MFFSRFLIISHLGQPLPASPLSSFFCTEASALFLPPFPQEILSSNFFHDSRSYAFLKENSEISKERPTFSPYPQKDNVLKSTHSWHTLVLGGQVLAGHFVLSSATVLSQGPKTKTKTSTRTDDSS